VGSKAFLQRGPNREEVTVIADVTSQKWGEVRLNEGGLTIHVYRSALRIRPEEIERLPTQSYKGPFGPLTVDDLPAEQAPDDPFGIPPDFDPFGPPPNDDPFGMPADDDPFGALFDPFGPPPEEPKVAPVPAEGGEDRSSLDVTQLKRGDLLQAHWGDRWWDATVQRVTDEGEIEVSWDGWSSSWNEIVPPSRLRPRPQAEEAEER
jgi:hypothetical protein